MATLVQVGNTVVNLDLVTQAYFKPGSVRLYFAVATGKADALHLDVAEFFGRDAVALRNYIEAISANATELEMREY